MKIKPSILADRPAKASKRRTPSWLLPALICAGLSLQSVVALGAVSNGQYIPLLGLFPPTALLPGQTGVLAFSRTPSGSENDDPQGTLEGNPSPPIVDQGVLFGPPIGVVTAKGIVGVSKNLDVAIETGTAQALGGATFDAAGLGVCTASGTATAPGARAVGACLDPPYTLEITSLTAFTYDPLITFLRLNVSGGENDFAAAKYFAAINGVELFSVEMSVAGDAATVDDIAIDVSGDLTRLSQGLLDGIESDLLGDSGFMQVGDGVFELADHELFSTVLPIDVSQQVLPTFTEGFQVGALVAPVPAPSTAALGLGAAMAMLFTGWRSKRRSQR